MDLKDFVKTLTNDVIQNGPSDLSKKSKFMELTATIPPEKGLVFHSIMGNITKSDDPNVITNHDDLSHFAPYYQHAPFLQRKGKPEPALTA